MAGSAATLQISRLRILGRVLFLAVMAFAFYGLAPRLLDMWDQVPQLRTVSIYWFVAILLCEVGSYACAWELTRIALPKVTWFVASTAQLTSNAVAKVVPGGAAIGAAIGFYDGFFGPGTGSFRVFLMVKVLGFDFLQASAHSKVLNLFSNLAAVILLASQGHVWWHLGIPLALANVAGSLLGSRMALKHGAVFVRWLFILVVATLALKTARDAWFV